MTFGNLKAVATENNSNQQLKLDDRPFFLRDFFFLSVFNWGYFHIILWILFGLLAIGCITAQAFSFSAYYEMDAGGVHRRGEFQNRWVGT